MTRGYVASLTERIYLTIEQVAILVPLTYFDSFLLRNVRRGRVDVNAWMERLIVVVQTSPDDKGARNNLLHLSHSLGETLREVSGDKKISWEKKNKFPAPEPPWPVIASLALRDKKLFNFALLETSEGLPLSVFTHLGVAMFIFDLPTSHEQ